MTSLRDHGFINFYGQSWALTHMTTLSSYAGMQRFGTSSVPTHVTGLAILRGEWGNAVDQILSPREGEPAECTQARLAWLEDGDVDRALALMPRRCVGERCIWEFFRKRPVTDKLGALSTVRSMSSHLRISYP